MSAMKIARENVVLFAASLVILMAQPAIVRAQTEYDWVNFTQPLNLSRGSLSPASRDAQYLSHEQTCRLVENEFGWDHGACDEIENLIIGQPANVDTLIVMRPNSDGFVKFDDWGDDADDEIEAIWDSFVSSSEDQSERLGVEVKPVRWQYYPTLDKVNSIMYYAVLMEWNGEPVLNVEAAYFDRQGYVPFKIVPVSAELGQADLEALLADTLRSYRPAAEQAYTNFTTGDKVAAAGALGVLATLLGVKYGKGAIAAALGVILLFAKKLWFIVLVAPFLALKRFFSGGRHAS